MQIVLNRWLEMGVGGSARNESFWSGNRVDGGPFTKISAAGDANWWHAVWSSVLTTLSLWNLWDVQASVSVTWQRQKPGSSEKRNEGKMKGERSLGPAGWAPELSSVFPSSLISTPLLWLSELLFTSSHFSHFSSVFHSKPANSHVTVILAWPVSLPRLSTFFQAISLNIIQKMSLFWSKLLISQCLRLCKALFESNSYSYLHFQLVPILLPTGAWGLATSIWDGLLIKA